MGKNSNPIFVIASRAQTGVRLGIVMKEKDVFHILVWMNSTDAVTFSEKKLEALLSYHPT
jgi:hypothetical protein